MYKLALTEGVSNQLTSDIGGAVVWWAYLSCIRKELPSVVTLKKKNTSDILYIKLPGKTQRE